MRAGLDRQQLDPRLRVKYPVEVLALRLVAHLPVRGAVRVQPPVPSEGRPATETLGAPRTDEPARSELDHQPVAHLVASQSSRAASKPQSQVVSRASG